jgi:hypothetical protein
MVKCIDMITQEEYSKDAGIKPEGIAVTFGREMIAEKGGLLRFIRWFERIYQDEDDYWMHKCKNKPRFDDLLYVYVIIHNRIYYRCMFGGYHGASATGHLHPDGPAEVIPWPYIILAGPLVKAPEKIIRPGFQGFRYTTKLF